MRLRTPVILTAGVVGFTFAVTLVIFGLVKLVLMCLWSIFDNWGPPG